jgi:molecular chaperone HtpG
LGAGSTEADVSRLLHMMVHSVYSDWDVFLRELIANAADACEKLRYEAIAQPELLGDDPKPRIVIRADQDARTLAVEANGHRHGARRDGRGVEHHCPLQSDLRGVPVR